MELELLACRLAPGGLEELTVPKTTSTSRLLFVGRLAEAWTGWLCLLDTEQSLRKELSVFVRYEICTPVVEEASERDRRTNKNRQQREPEQIHSVSFLMETDEDSRSVFVGGDTQSLVRAGSSELRAALKDIVSTCL
ncbi:unnamed protein product [Pleuronectes platessa]|uniref:Uncharacterized protein n=1 Tax=Pleuronectes platessa TaxID=8262 RepID=A0A9N7YAF2_PLEPL|nr:unnamed protein product [Pleuronectes platessa]